MPAFGPFLKIGDPAVAELIGLAGFDFAIIDMEHGPISYENAQNLVRASLVTGMAPIIRVSTSEPHAILRALDIGAVGVQVPHIESRQCAESVGRRSRYAPKGERGVCRFVRAAGYSSIDKQDYFKSANQETLVIVHIEGKQGLENLDEILKVEGLDVIFLGPYDLSQSLEVPGEVNHPVVVEKMKEAVIKANKAGVTVGTFVEDVGFAENWLKTGVGYIAFSVDVGIMFSACQKAMKELRSLV